MIKCPNCGSTAQVKLVCQPFISVNTLYLTEGFECGCGAHFSVEYERNEKGTWEHYSTFIDYIVKKEGE